MFAAKHKRNNFLVAWSILRLIFVNTVRDIRKSHGNPILGLINSMLQIIMMVVVFYFMFTILGLRGMAIKGDFVVYLMTGIFLFLTHNKTMGAVAGAGGATSAMMLHGPMNTAIGIVSAALGALYIQVLSVLVIYFGYYMFTGGIAIQSIKGVFGMFLMAWASGAAIGTVFLAATPWAPKTIGLLKMLYMRANMITSGKMFVANTLPGFMLPFFIWNPLFHTIDQARGFAFKDYTPVHTSVSYSIYFTLVFLFIGMLGEFFTRHRVSSSWNAGK